MKKIFSILSAIFIFAVCGVFTACGDKYSGFEYNILYAFTQDADEWLSGNDGITVNYGANDDSSLKDDDDDGYYTLYLKVEVKNVKAKHIDDIVVSKVGTSSGIVFTQGIIRQGEVLPIKISGRAASTLKIYETNSGNEKSIALNVYKSLEGLDVDYSIRPAVVPGGSIALSSLDNIIYQPHGLTNQTGVKYQLDGVGGFTDGEFNQLSSDVKAELTETGLLRVANSSIYGDVGNDNYVIRVKITSLFNEEKWTYMYVYVADSVVSSLNVSYVKDDATVGNAVEDVFDLYMGSTRYSSVVVKPDFASTGNIYAGDGADVYGGKAKYNVAIYINDRTEKYNADTASDVDGIIIADQKNGSYRITATNSSTDNVKITFVMEIDGFVFDSLSAAASAYPKRVFNVKKGILPETISFNGELPGMSGLHYDVYSTSSAAYKGVELTVHAVPTDETINTQMISVQATDKVVICDADGVTLSNVANKYSIRSGSTVYIKFADRNITEDQTIVFSVVTSPGKFAGENIAAPSIKNVSCTLSNKVTADRLEMLDEKGDVVTNKYIDSSVLNPKAHIKVYYTGSDVDEESIQLKSLNSGIKFRVSGVNLESINLTNCEYVDGGTVDGSDQKYAIYAIPLAKMAYGVKGDIQAVVGHGTVGIYASLTLQGVKLADGQTFSFVSDKATKNTALGAVAESKHLYSVAINDYVEFDVVAKVFGSTGYTTDAIHDISVSKAVQAADLGVVNPEFESHYSTNVIHNLRKINKDSFSVTGTSIGSYHTGAVKVVVSYFEKDEEYGVISIVTKDLYLEVAVYNPISSFIVNCPDDSISYINNEYNESATTEVKFSAVATVGEPSNSVQFSAGLVAGATSTLVTAIVIGDPQIAILYNGVDITTDVTRGAGYTIADYRQQTLVVQVLDDTAVGSIVISFKALRFGEESDVVDEQVINIVAVDKAKGVELDELAGQDYIKEESNNSRYAYMSYLKGSRDTISFLARAYYDKNQSSLDRYDELTYLIDEAQYDNVQMEYVTSDGALKFVPVANNSFDVLVEEVAIAGVKYYKFTVTVDQNLVKGGLYKFTVASKDSYDGDKYTTYNDFFIQLSDGSQRSPYIIGSEDLYNINNNLSAHYVLGEDIIIDKLENPIGADAAAVSKEFVGTLSGKMTKYMSDGTVAVGYERTITISIDESINSYNDGSYEYLGLFASIGKKGKVCDLNLIVNIGAEIICSRPLQFGALAGKNAGVIENVTLTLAGGLTLNEYCAKEANIGGLVGWNTGTIRNVSVDNSQRWTIVSRSVCNAYLGLVSGVNEGYIVGNYTGKSDLESLKHDVVANINIYDDPQGGFNYSATAFYIGAVAGVNKGSIADMLVGGRIDNTGAYIAASYLGGIAAEMNGADGSVIEINNCVAIGLDLIQCGRGSVAGIVARAQKGIVSHSSYMSAVINYYNIGQVKGYISGQGYVAGIAAHVSTGVSLYETTVENFAGEGHDTLIANEGVNELGTVNGVSSTVSGLVVENQGSIEYSFVSANIRAIFSADGTTYKPTVTTLSNGNIEYSYYLGKITFYQREDAINDNNVEFTLKSPEVTSTTILADIAHINNSNNVYSVVKFKNEIYINGTATALNTITYLDYEIVDVYDAADISAVFVETTVDSETFTYGTHYKKTGNVYELAAEYFTATTYYTFNENAWQHIVDKLYVIDVNNNLVKANTVYAPVNYYILNNIDINTIYIKDGKDGDVFTKHNKNEPFEAGVDYCTVSIGNYDPKTMTGATGSKIENGVEYEWAIKEDTNTISLEDILWYLPYLTANDQPIMIMQPQDIDVAVDNDMIESIGSVEIEEIPDLEFDVNSSHLINYHNYSENPLINAEYNTYTLVTQYKRDINGNYELDGDGNRIVAVQGLVDLTISPDYAQGGVVAEVVREGGRAKIKGNEITFLGVSGQSAIIVKFYSIFNPELVEYVAFYTELGITDIVLSGNRVEQVYDTTADHDYIMYTYTGHEKTLVEFSAENVYNDISFDTIMLSQAGRLRIDAQSSNPNVKIESSSANNMGGVSISCADFDGEDNWIESIITFELYIDGSYYGSDSDILLTTCYLKVVVYKSAHNVDILSGDIESSVGVKTEFVTELLTGYIEYNGEYTQELECIASGDRVYLESHKNQDTLIMQISALTDNDLDRVERLQRQAGVDDLTDLFNFEAIYRTIKSGSASLGYRYTISLQLKDEHNYRYIEENINLNVRVMANTNWDKYDEFVLTLTPQRLSSARISNYAATSINPVSAAVNLFESNHTETSLISPGGIGGVMVIHLEPSYAKVLSATLSSSKLVVPSLGNREVQITFQQLVRTPEGKYQTVATANDYTDDGAMILRKESILNSDGTYSYTGVIYIHTVLSKFEGLNDTITVTLNTEVAEGEFVPTYKHLLTEYMPGAGLVYNGEVFKNGYVVQKGTYDNMELKLYGYEFESNPTFSVEWYLGTETLPDGTVVDKTSNELYTIDADGNLIDNYGKVFRAGDYVMVNVAGRVEDLEPNADKSYTLPAYFQVSQETPVPFKINARLSLSAEGGLVTSDENAGLIFYPTQYVIKEGLTVDSLINGELRVGINTNTVVDLKWNTMSTTRDYSDQVTALLVDNLISEYENELASGNPSSQDMKTRLLNAFKMNRFGLYEDQEYRHPEFNIDYEDGEILIRGLSPMTSRDISFSIQYGYYYDEVTCMTSLRFGTMSSNTLSKTAACEFDLTVSEITSEDKPKAIYTADDFLKMEDGQNYILINDIELFDYTPINKKIASLDGNNRIISIMNFKADTNRTNYGLFDTLGTYTHPITRKTDVSILKNIIVDYSMCDKIYLTNTNAKSIVFGGLVANNNALIYNCDVINRSFGQDKIVNILVDADDSITFGGLVGVNGGYITNSRVGTGTYVRITKTGKSTFNLGTLQFVIGNTTDLGDQTFVAIAGGFVGVNSGTISTSYLANTSLISYSQAPGESMTAGFVAENSGNINYSYVKALESSITAKIPRATGRQIENKADGHVAGFVYVNNSNAVITNAYANTELCSESAYVAGFVYNNMGTISESYAACTLNPGVKSNSAMQPFVGANASNDILSTGTLDNTFFHETNTDLYYVIEQEGRDQATGYTLDSFTSPEALTGFVFVLSNSVQERNQGVWAHYTSGGSYVSLPELVNANTIARSYRYEDTINGETVYLNAGGYRQGSANNPYIIRSAEEYNNILGARDSFAGYVRLISDVMFDDGNSNIAIMTRTKYTLGDSSTTRPTITSIEGNGMTISGVWFDSTTTNEHAVGLFSQIANAYVKNLNIEFDSTPFSTSSAIYSGGLAGKMHNTVVINVKLDGAQTTIIGENFAGGLAGLITGDSLVYGVDSNLSVAAGSTYSNMYYSEDAFKTLKANGVIFSHNNYNDYITTVSFAGGIAGVIDISEPSETPNFEYINIDGVSMTTVNQQSTHNANIDAQYAGGVAGYAGVNVNASRVKLNVGDNLHIYGGYAVGGLFGVSLAKINASQVTYEEDVQYEYDTILGQYIIDIEDTNTAELDLDTIGNRNLLSSTKYAGGLVGIGINQLLGNSYAKATFANDDTTHAEVIGGLVGMSIADSISYSYAVPFIELNENTTYIGGLIGRAYEVDASTTSTRDQDISEHKLYLAKVLGISSQKTTIFFTFSTILAEQSQLAAVQTGTQWLDYICPDENGDSTSYLRGMGDNYALTYVYSGIVSEKTPTGYLNIKNHNINRSNRISLRTLYDVKHPDHITNYQQVFSGWPTRYWTLDPSRYFPLLLQEASKEFIEIKNKDDLYKIESNPDGNFKIMEDIDMSDWCSEHNSNYVFDIDFTGVMIGEKDDNETPYLYNIFIKATRDTTAGFFRSTDGAIFSNINFSWGTTVDETISTNKQEDGIKVDAHVTTIGMVTPADSGSQFTGISVGMRIKEGENTNGVLVETTGTGTINGYGGLVGYARHSYIVGCRVYGGINVTLGSGDAYVGGLIAEGDGQDTTSVGEDSAYKLTVSGSMITANINPTELRVRASANTGNVCYGGAIGKVQYGSISALQVGAEDDISGKRQIKFVSIYWDAEGHTSNLSLGGMIGYSDQSHVSSVSSFNNIYVGGDTSAPADTDIMLNYNVGGLVGYYTAENGEKLKIDDAYLKTEINIGWYDYTTDPYTAHGLSVGTLRVSGVVAYATRYVSMNKVLAVGNIHTIDESQIGVIYSAGLLALATDGAFINITESMSAIDQNIGTSATTICYAGGIIGQAGGKATVDYSVSSGKIIMLASAGAGKFNKDEVASYELYFGGMIGSVTSSLDMSYSYTTTSIITSSLPSVVVTVWHKGALLGADPYDANISNVYYSTDIALAPEDTLLGNNIGAYTMYNGEGWNNELLNSNHYEPSTTKVPIISNLRNRMVILGLLTETDNGYKYIEGSSLRPQSIANYDDEKFNYYIINDANNLAINLGTDRTTGTPITEFKGILIGENEPYAIDVMTGLLPGIAKNSAISNIHVNVGMTIKNGLVANNYGTIFNCSVQGVGLKTEGIDENAIGLINNNNYGLVSYSYSSAEIIEHNSNYIVAGIVYANSVDVDKAYYAKIESCYFTGHICYVLGYGVTATGIVGCTNKGSYVYNSYMAGMIVKKGSSAVSIPKPEKSSFFVDNYDGSLIDIGSNNYIDSYISDGGYGVQAIRTARLMGASGLSGKWYTAIKTAEQLNEEWNTSVIQGAKLDLSAKSYGYNYCYPVYNFNKQLVGLNNEITLYQLNTGRGYMSVDDEGIHTYNHSTIDMKDQDYFKIPHLGVLDAVRSVASEGLLLRLIYDIDYYETEITMEPWTAIGATVIDSGAVQTTINGWDCHRLDGENLVENNVFNGQFVSHRNFASPESTGPIDKCIVSGLTNNGLFANIQNATIAYITLGSFKDLKSSGALGVNVIEGDADQKVNIHNIEFISDPNSIVEGRELVGALLGDISGNVQVYNFGTNDVTVKDQAVESGLPTASIGLIAGRMTKGVLTTGIIETSTMVGVASVSEEAWSVKFGPALYAGGLVGQMISGTIDGRDIKLKVDTDLDTGDKDLSLGGIVGLLGYKTATEKDPNRSPLIKDVQVLLGQSRQSGVSSDVEASTFGGLAAKVNIGAWFDKCTVLLQHDYVIMAEDPGGFGLIAASLETGSEELLVVNDFSVIEKDNNEYTIKYFVGNADPSRPVGVGVLTGYQDGNLAVSIKEDFTPTIDSSVPNVGGVTGYYNGGQYYIITRGVENPYNVTIKGYENVGGAFGVAADNVILTDGTNNYLASDAKEKFVEGTMIDALSERLGYDVTFNDAESEFMLNFLNYEKGTAGGYATVDLSTNLGSGGSRTLKNFGGLFGVYQKSSLGPASGVDGITICNYNDIVITTANSQSFVLNVGGVVGEFIGTSDEDLQISRIANAGNIKVVYTINLDDDINPYYNISYYTKPSDTSGIADVYTPNLINVGGIVGYAKQVEIMDCSNTGEIHGYRNVGGVVGYASKSVTISSSALYQSESTVGTTAPIYFDDNYMYSRGANKYVINEDAKANDGTIIGVLNVGGIVGLSDGASINMVWNAGKVYGNTSVGGIAGYSKSASITRSIVKDATVSGVYYAENNGRENYSAKGDRVALFIPTSVGGLVGSALDSHIAINTLYSIEIISANEGVPFIGASTKDIIYVNSKTINTIANNVAALKFDSVDDNADYISTGAEKGALNIDWNRIQDNTLNANVEFNSMTTGFGGFIGSVDAATINKQSKEYLHVSDSTAHTALTNSLVNIVVNAQLGINVGTAYGYMDVNVTESDGDANSYDIHIPKMYGDTKVTGAYNIGGVAGHINIDTSATDFIYTNIDESFTSDVSITLQAGDVSGQYIGGLFGKLVSDKTKGLALPINGNQSKIKIKTDLSYYMGGLVGRLEMRAGGIFNANIDQGNEHIKVTEGNITDIISNTHFGGLIGMLKVVGSSNGDIKVEGRHGYAFTINTIENENYHDAESSYEVEESGLELYVIATAYYINKDNFVIQGTSNDKWYTYDDDNKPTNPISGTTGWAKEYTGFRSIQRCIPQSQNNGAQWASIENIYDAGMITYVATIASLGLESTTLPGSDWLWDGTDYSNDMTERHKILSCKDIANEYKLWKDNNSSTNIISRPTTNDGYDGDYSLEVRQTAYDSVPMIEKKSDGYIFNPNYICYTIYEEEEGDPTLYSAMGIATLNTGTSNEGQLVYAPLVDNAAGLLSKVAGAFLDPSMVNSSLYIDANNKDNKLQGLTYFTWATSDTNCKDYTTNGRGKAKMYDTDTDPNVTISYFVKGYKPLQLKDDQTWTIQVGDSQQTYTLPKGNAKYDTHEQTLIGAYFQFDVIYDNVTLDGFRYGEGGENYLLGNDSTISRSGSIFEVVGYQSRNTFIMMNTATNQTATVSYWATQIVVFAVLAVLTFVTTPGGSAIIASAGQWIAKKVASMTAKQIIKTVLVISLTSALATTLLTTALIAEKEGQMYSKASILKNYNQHHGLISATYTRDIHYTKVNQYTDQWALNVKFDSSRIEGCQAYLYYSSNRPSDYYSAYYIGVPVTGPEGGVYTLQPESDLYSHPVSVDAEHGTCKQAGSDATYDCLIYDNQALFKKYIYDQGVYYINSNTAILETQICQDFFDANTIFVPGSKPTTSFRPENKDNYWAQDDEGRRYVLGYYNTTTGVYSIGMDAYGSSIVPSNKLRYNKEIPQYEIDGKPFPRSTISPYITADIPMVRMKNPDIDKYDKSGYDYINSGMIYTANGQKNVIDSTGGFMNNKVGKFEYVGFSVGLEKSDLYYEYDPDKNAHESEQGIVNDLGTVGVDYIWAAMQIELDSDDDNEYEPVWCRAYYQVKAVSRANGDVSDAIDTKDYTEWQTGYNKNYFITKPTISANDANKGEWHKFLLPDGFYYYLDINLYPKQFYRAGEEGQVENLNPYRQADANIRGAGELEEDIFNSEIFNDKFEYDYQFNIVSREGRYVCKSSDTGYVWVTKRAVIPKDSKGRPFMHGAEYYYYEGGYEVTTAPDGTTRVYALIENTESIWYNEDGQMLDTNGNVMDFNSTGYSIHQDAESGKYYLCYATVELQWKEGYLYVGDDAFGRPQYAKIYQETGTIKLYDKANYLTIYHDTDAPAGIGIPLKEVSTYIAKGGYYIKDGGTPIPLEDVYYAEDANAVYALIEGYGLSGHNMLEQQSITVHKKEEDQFYNYNKYLSNSSVDFYTRYKYMYYRNEDKNSFDKYDLTGAWQDNYYSIERSGLFNNVKVDTRTYTTAEGGQMVYLIPDKMKTNPNGAKTLFVESLKVTLGGGRYLNRIDPTRVKSDTYTGHDTTSGNIKVK